MIYTLRITVGADTHTATYEAATLEDAIAEAQTDHDGVVVEESS